MNSLKRAIVSVSRRPSKSVILLLLVFILGTVTLSAISAGEAISNTEENLRNNMRPIVTFSFNEDEARETLGSEAEMGTLTPELVREIAMLPYVEHHNYSIRTHLSTPTLDNYVPPSDLEMTVSGGGFGDFFTVLGSSHPELLEVNEGMFDLVSGRMFTNSEIETVGDVHPVIISSGLAETNHLSLGGVFDVTLTTVLPQLGDSWNPAWENNPENIFSEEIMRFEVIGIVELSEDEARNDDLDLMAELVVYERVNTLFLPNASAEVIQRFQTEDQIAAMEYVIERDNLNPADISGFNPNSEHETSVTSIMELYDVSDLEAFRIAAESLLPDFWEVEDLSNTFDEISSAMLSVQEITNWIFWASFVATLLILSLTITLFLRDRRYEMGIYLALGEKKIKVVLQILGEVVVIAVVGITLAVFTGNSISNAITHTMLRNELATEQRNNNNDVGFGMGWGEQSLGSMGFAQVMSPEEMLESFDVSLDGTTVGLFYVIGLGTVVFSTVIPVLYVVTLNPKKVLMGGVTQ